ncbi:hypothetical protein PROFUN_07468 [Planoprotostelium fungivorum]|uniref:Uncharacterized protein n=1 Tax=Planoprotostelium fungivorum TaxID=1890364 RepID=A0A2P6NLH9_9EUKA|nr:hypothetical protein PROFUN_07468 [Planoprotostelium fungivorum]
MPEPVRHTLGLYVAYRTAPEFGFTDLQQKPIESRRWSMRYHLVEVFLDHQSRRIITQPRPKR